MVPLAIAVLCVAATVVASSEPRIEYHNDGRVTLHDGEDTVDLTGWMSVDPNASIADPSLRFCMACETGEPQPMCTRVLQRVYSAVCGASGAARKAAAAQFHLENDPDEWCNLKCDFAHFAHEPHESDEGGLVHTDAHCMHIPLAACHDKLRRDHAVAHMVQSQHVPRRLVARSVTAESLAHQLLMTMHADESMEPQHAEVPTPLPESAVHEEHERHHEEVTAAVEREHRQEATRRLNWIMQNRNDALLPPAPKACSSCADFGTDSSVCKLAVYDLARNVCVDGDEIDLCHGISRGCTPFPRQGGHVDIHRHPAGHANEEADENPAVPLPPPCVSLLEHICAHGVVEPGPGVGIRHRQQSEPEDEPEELHSHPPPPPPRDEL